MKSNQYWKDRANERMAEYHKNSDKTIFKINNAYDKAIEDINNDINKIFYKFATDGDLSEEDARILLNSKIPKKELDEIRAKINFIEDTDLKKYLMSQLNADAYKARITRLEALKESIYINTKKAADVELQQSQLGYINNIKESYYRNIYDIQKGTEIVTDFATLPVNAIEEILKNNWSGKHYSERVWGNSDVLASKLEEVITSGIMSGKNSKKMATELEELSTYGKMAAERLVRTETTYVTNMAELESYKELDIDKYIFVATLDLRTSPMCREMDGKIIEVSKGIPGENLPPLHPWCRSTTRAYFEGMTRRRRARDPETGKNYIIEDMDYKEWYQKCVVDKYGEQKAETFQKMIKNKASDKKQYAKYKEILGENVPKSFGDFQNLKYNNIKGYEMIKSNFSKEFIKKDFDKMPSFHKNCSNLKTREWYKWHDENIPNLLDKTKSIEEQARQAHELRNTYRTQARDLMKDQEARIELDKKHPNITFEDLIEHKKLKYGLSSEEAYKDIIRSSQTTNKKYDKIAGIKED